MIHKVTIVQVTLVMFLKSMDEMYYFTKHFLFLFTSFLNLLAFRESKARKKGMRDRERKICCVHLFMHSLVASCLCPDLGSNLQPWHIG